MTQVCVLGVFQMSAKRDEIKRVQVSFTKEQWNLIEKLKGEMGITDSEIVRNIIMGWLMEKSFISTTLKEKLFKRNLDDNQ
jgi:hypothetical protein